MKKFLVVALSIVLVLSLSFTASARHATEESEYNPGMTTAEGVQIEMTGSIRSRGEFRDNVNLFDDDMGDNSTAYDTRVRLKFNIRVTPSTIAVVELESGGEEWDNNSMRFANGNDTWRWGTVHNATGLYQNSNAKRGELMIRQAYVSHQGSELLGRPAGVKVGHMLLALGNGLFFDHSKFGDDAVILWTGIGDGELSFIYSKFVEGSTTENDDHNAYIVSLEYPAGGVNIGADLTYLDMQDNGVSGATTHFYNLGLRGDIAVAGINLRGDLELQAGEVEMDAGDDIDFEGYAWLVGADLDVSGITLSAEVAYGSGDGDATDNDAETFINSLGSSQHYTYVYEYRTPSSIGMTGTGLANTWYVNVGAATDLSSDLNGSVDIYYLQASEEVSMFAADADEDLGWEIDAKLEYTIDKNLLYYIEGGYFFPGDAYDLDNTTSADNAFAVRNGITLKF